MFNFLKNLFTKTSDKTIKAVETVKASFDPKQAAKYYVDHLMLHKEEPTHGLRFAVLTTVDLSAHQGDPNVLFDLHVSSVEVAALDVRAKTYLDNASPGALKATVATLCFGAGEYSMYETTPVNRETPADKNVDTQPPPLPNKDTLLN